MNRSVQRLERAAHQVQNESGLALAVKPAKWSAGQEQLEIVAEKLRALLQQQDKWPRPRDLYDLWFILCQQREPVPTKQLRELFQLLPTLDHGPDYDWVWREWTALCPTIL